MVKRISATITFRDKEFLDKLVKDGIFANRSEALRNAIELLRRQQTHPYLYETRPPYLSNHHKPPATSLSGGAHSYPITVEERMELMNEIKEKQIERGTREAPLIEVIDSGFDDTLCDESKCKEPLEKGGKIVQCPNFRLDGEDYCRKHLKKKQLLVVGLR